MKALVVIAVLALCLLATPETLAIGPEIDPGLPGEGNAPGCPGPTCTETGIGPEIDPGLPTG